MPSSKGKPKNAELHDKITEDVKSQTNKDGSGQGKMAAWKATKIAKEYEANGGEYENEPGSKNKPKKGAPEHKSEATKAGETHSSFVEKAADCKDGDKKTDEAAEDAVKEDHDDKEKPKANIGKKTTRPIPEKAIGKPVAKKAAPKEEKEAANGTRHSSREAAASKRKAVEVEEDEKEDSEKGHEEDEDTNDQPRKKKKSLSKKAKSTPKAVEVEKDDEKDSEEGHEEDEDTGDEPKKKKAASKKAKTAPKAVAKRGPANERAVKSAKGTKKGAAKA